MSNYRTEDVERLAGMFSALANPNRVRILLRLVSCCSGVAADCADDELCACVGELGEDLGIAPSTVSHHLKELNRAGLIRMERNGRTVKCWVDSQTVQELANFLKQVAPVRPRTIPIKNPGVSLAEGQDEQ